MCLLGILYHSLPDTSALVFANREEDYARPTAPPQIHPPQGDAAAWMGGTDLLAGGTWLGVNELGLLVAVTNLPKQNVPPVPRSRGLLCRELLGLRDPELAEQEALRQLRELPFAGCNIVIINPQRGIVIEAGDLLRVHTLGPGLHLLANGDLDDPADRRLQRVRAEWGRVPPRNLDESIAVAMRICGERAMGDQPAICLEGTTRGTVSSTIIVLAQNNKVCRYLHAPGPPSRTTYGDQSSMLRQLLGDP